MARIRSIHPGILTDESFMTLTVESPLAIALMIGLWMEADDAGTFEWKPITLKARCLPAANTNVSDLLDALQSVEMVKRFEIDGKPYGVIRNFIKYQRPRDPKIIYDQSDEMFSFAGGGDGYGDGPLNFSRDLTATERKRRQRERDKNGECHGLGVTKTGVTRGIPEMSRQMKEVGCRMEEEKKDNNSLRSLLPEREKKNGFEKKAIAKDATISDENLGRALASGLTNDQTAAEWQKFKAWHLSEGKKSADWDAAWSLWVSRRPVQPSVETRQFGSKSPVPNVVPAIDRDVETVPGKVWIKADTPEWDRAVQRLGRKPPNVGGGWYFDKDILDGLAVSH